MKVLHIISGDLWAGAEVQAFTLLTALQKINNIQIKVALMNAGTLADKLREKNISVVLFPEASMGALSILIGLVRLMKEWQPDVVHTHRIKENILGSIANRLATNAKSVRTAHGANEHPPKGLRQIHKHILNRMNRWAGNHLQQKVIAVSSDLAEKLACEYPREKIIVIENGVDIDAVLAQVHPVEFREAAPTAKHIGIVGRLVPVKRVDIFLDMAALLRRQYSERNWRFHIFGDGPLLAALTAQAAQLQITDIVTFHGHRSDIIACIAGLDVLMMCSDHEGLPMTMLEAIVLEIPVVAHAVGSLTELLSEYPSSTLIKHHTAHHYANAVEQLINLSGSRKMTTVSSRYTAAENTKRIIELYSLVLRDH